MGRACSHLPSKGNTGLIRAFSCLLFSFLLLFATCVVRNTENERCDSILLSFFFLKTFKKDWKGISESEHTAPSQAAMQQALPWETWTLGNSDAAIARSWRASWEEPCNKQEAVPYLERPQSLEANAKLQHFIIWEESRDWSGFRLCNTASLKKVCLSCKRRTSDS